MARGGSNGFLRGLGIAFLIFVVVAAASGLVLYQSARHAMGEFDVIQASAHDLEDALSTGDAEGVKTAIGRIDDAAHAIHRDMGNPLWVPAQYLPVYGNDVRVARTLSDVLVDLTDNVLVPLGDDAIYLTLDGYVNSDGINLDGIGELAGLMQSAQPVVERSYATVEALPDPTLAKLDQAKSTALEALEATRDILSLVNDISSSAGDFASSMGW